MNILVIEEEHKIANALKRGLEQESHTIDLAYDGDKGLHLATQETYDLVIVDRVLTDKYDGLEIVKRMRQRAIHIPVLLLTPRNGVKDRMNGLDAGADELLAKPFAFEELLAKVRALLRRPGAKTEDSLLTYLDITLDPINFNATRASKQINLTHKEFALLEFFMRNPGKLLSKDMLIQHVWDYNADVLPNTVEVYVGYLRNKIEKPFKAKSLIKTRRGFGYVFGEAPAKQPT